MTSESDTTPMTQKPRLRRNKRRSSSIDDALNSIGHKAVYQLAEATTQRLGSLALANPDIPLLPRVESRSAKSSARFSESSGTRGIQRYLFDIWDDVKSLRWMREPACSFRLLMIPLFLYCAFELITRHIFGHSHNNPFSSLLFISYRLSDSDPLDPRFDKGWLDLAFLSYYVIFFSFVRQFVTIHIIIPFAKSLGIKKKSKLDRFAEQGYAVLYWGTFGALGIYVMSGMPTWWFNTKHFWLEYPQWRMTGLMKSYYLLQAAYWTQQLLVMALGIEKPRKDFLELAIHHAVTIYLIGASYIVNLTWIGNAVFITMDVSDTFFALSKIFNYLKMNRTKMVAFVWFTGVWSYLRHWLNIMMLYSVWFEFDLIPEKYRTLDPANHAYMPTWAKGLILLPLCLLQLVNLFWYFLILRILIRAIMMPDFDKVDDDRSEDECDGDDEAD